MRVLPDFPIRRARDFRSRDRPAPDLELARELEMTVLAIGYAVRRGEIVAARVSTTLIDSVI